MVPRTDGLRVLGPSIEASVVWLGCDYAGNVSSSHLQVSLGLTTLAPQPPHKSVNAYRFLCSQRFDRIVRNEGVTGSNPVSSTEHPGQG